MNFQYGPPQKKKNYKKFTCNRSCKSFLRAMYMYVKDQNGGIAE